MEGILAYLDKHVEAKNVNDKQALRVNTEIQIDNNNKVQTTKYREQQMRKR